MDRPVKSSAPGFTVGESPGFTVAKRPRLEDIEVEGDGRVIKVQDTLAKLRFLSALSQNDRVDTSTMSSFRYTLFNKLWRWYNNYMRSPEDANERQDRAKFLETVRTSTDDALELATRCYQRAEIKFGNADLAETTRAEFFVRVGDLLLAALRECTACILPNLPPDYHNDSMFYSSTSTMISLLDTKIQALAKLRPNVLKPDPATF